MNTWPPRSGTRVCVGRPSSRPSLEGHLERKEYAFYKILFEKAGINRPSGRHISAGLQNFATGSFQREKKMHKNEGTNEHIGNICLIFNNSNSCVENEREGEKRCCGWRACCIKYLEIEWEYRVYFYIVCVSGYWGRVFAAMAIYTTSNLAVVVFVEPARFLCNAAMAAVGCG